MIATAKALIVVGRAEIRRLPRMIRTSIAVIVYAYAVGSMVNDIEKYVAPVVREISIDPYMRTDQTICWTRTLEKKRDAKYEFFSWFVQDARDPNTRMSLAPYDPASHLPNAVSKVKVGRQSFPQCFDLPTPLQGKGRPLIFEAHAAYNVRHSLWRVPHHVEPFIVHGLETIKAAQ